MATSNTLLVPRSTVPLGVSGARYLVGGALALLAIYIVLSYPLGARSGYVQVTQYLLLAVTAIGAISCIREDRPRLASLVFWLFTYAILGIVQVVQLSEQRNPFNTPAPDRDVERQLTLLLVGIAGFIGGQFVASRRETPPKQDDEPVPRRNLTLRRVVAWSVVTILLSPLLAARLGGVGVLLSSRETLSTALISSGGGDITTTQALLLGIANVAPFVCAFALIRLRVAGVFTFRGRLDLIVLLLALIAVNVVFNNPVSQARYWVATMLIAVAVSGRWIVRPRFQAAFILGFIFMALVAFPSLDRFRYETGPVENGGLLNTYLAKTDYGSAQDITNAVSYVDALGHTDGRQLLGVALFFVPRSVWADKPTDTNQLLATHIGYSNLNIDSPLWAEGYVDYGFPGAFALLGAFGLILSRVDRSFSPIDKSRSASALFVPIFVGYELILIRGSLLQAMGRLAVLVVFTLLLSEAVTSRNQSRSLGRSVARVTD